MSLVSDALGIARAGIRACEPGPALRRAIAVRARRVRIEGDDWSAAVPGGVHVLALGKAAGPMVDAASVRLGRSLGRSLAAAPRGYPSPTTAARTVWGDHPVPGPGSLAAGRALERFVQRLPEGEPLLCLISGGGSATAELPSPPLTLSDVATTTRLLMARGVPIGPANTLRRHLSDLKGGGLARRCGDRPLATLAISDVIGDAPEDIASGPTVPDPTRFSDAWRVVRTYSLGPDLPIAVRRHLEEGARRERRGRSAHRRAAPPFFRLIGSNRHAVEAAGREARRRGYSPQVRAAPLQGEASVLGLRIARSLSRASRTARSSRAWISGGESTVTLPPHPGKGGRNQELAMAAAEGLDGTAGTALLSIGSDGIDGPTDAAGGWADGATAARARALGIDLARALRAHDSYATLGRLGRRVTTGPTGTNVADLQVGLVAGRTGSTPRRGDAGTSRRRRS